jgi:hypothetical protein
MLGLVVGMASSGSAPAISSHLGTARPWAPRMPS